MDIYLVGGAVRDELLGRPVSERDWVVVGATVADLESRGFKQVGKDFPVFLHPDTHEEYALARTERKTAPGYHGFAVHASPEVTLEDDLGRRDLTINAMARDPDGTIIDPFGGLYDISNRWLRHVTPAFAEDPVRILRIARFAARYAPLGFRVAPETVILMRQMVDAGETDALVAERVWAETLKALGEPAPGRFIEVLRECGALARIFPEIDRLFGVPQNEKYHPEIDTGAHLLLCLEQAVRLNADPLVRFAVLVHDLGKGTTPREQWPSHKGHEQRSAELAREFCRRLKVPNDYRDLGVMVGEYHLHCHTARELQPDALVDLLTSLDAFRRPERFERFLLACEIDSRGRLGLTERDYPQADYLRRVREAAAAVDIRTLVAQGLKGPELVTAIRDARIQAIADCRSDPI